MPPEFAEVIALSDGPVWTTDKPTCSGVYGIRGWQFGEAPEDQFEAAVLVRRYEDELVCNLHEDTTESDFDRWMLVSDINDKFEWCRFEYARATHPTPSPGLGEDAGWVALSDKLPAESGQYMTCMFGGSIMALYYNQARDYWTGGITRDLKIPKYWFRLPPRPDTAQPSEGAAP